MTTQWFAESKAKLEWFGLTQGLIGETQRQSVTLVATLIGPHGPVGTIDATTMASTIDSASVKTTPVDADTFGIVDSADSNELKKLSFANLWTWVKAKFATAEVYLNSGNVGIGDFSASTIVGKLHVKVGTGSGATPNTAADDFIFEGNGNFGMSLLSPDANSSNIYFGSPTDSSGARLNWKYNDNILIVGTSRSSADLVFQSGNSSEKVRLKSDGKLGVGTNAPTALLDVNSDIVRLRTAKTPASASATGNAGDICWDSSYVYVCVATDTWKRSALATW